MRCSKRCWLGVSHAPPRLATLRLQTLSLPHGIRLRGRLSRRCLRSASPARYIPQDRMGGLKRRHEEARRHCYSSSRSQRYAGRWTESKQANRQAHTYTGRQTHTYTHTHTHTRTHTHAHTHAHTLAQSLLGWLTCAPTLSSRAASTRDARADRATSASQQKRGVL